MRLGDLDDLKEVINDLFRSGEYDCNSVLKAIDNATTIEPETMRLALIDDIRQKQMAADKAFLQGYEKGYEKGKNENASTVEEIEKPFITECRNASIEKGLPLYFVYYEETGVLEVYKTDTKELFEKRHCVKQMPAYEFQQLAIRYLDEYSNWGGEEK